MDRLKTQDENWFDRKETPEWNHSSIIGTFLFFLDDYSPTLPVRPFFLNGLKGTDVVLDRT